MKALTSASPLACLVAMALLVLAASNNANLTTESCHLASARCFSNYLIDQNAQRYISCVEGTIEKFGEEACGSCPFDRRLLAQKSIASLKISSKSMEPKKVACYNNCYHEELHSCDAEGFVDCMWECVGETKIEIKAQSPQKADECDSAAFRQCMEDYLFPADTEKLGPCLDNTNCVDYCRGLMSLESFVAATNGDETTKECFIDTYMAHLETCDWEISDFDVCYPEATPERTKECQDEVVACIAGRKDTNSMNDCMQDAYMSWGYSTCIPCAAEARETSEELIQEATSTTNSIGIDWKCDSECYRGFLETCDTGSLAYCQLGCLTTNGDSSAIENIESEQEQGTGYVSFSILAFLAICALSAFVIAYQRKTRSVADDRVYEQLIA